MPASIDDILNSHRTARPIIAGILNITPDSFSDGGKFLASTSAIGQAHMMGDEGADIIDIGGESTRPGSARVSADEQIRRLHDTLHVLAQWKGDGRQRPLISVDTTSAAVADFALTNGADIINDISAGRDDPGMFPLVAARGCPIILMHMLGEPGTMQKNPQYRDVVAQVRDFLAQRVEQAVAAGIARRNCIVDPGIGFGKTKEHNLKLLANTRAIAELGLPIMIGVSRKRFIGEITGQARPHQRMWGTVAACLATWQQGATIFRVHNVAPLAHALAVAAAIRNCQ